MNVHEKTVSNRVMKRVKPVVENLWPDMNDADKKLWADFEKQWQTDGQFRNSGQVERWSDDLVRRTDKAKAKAEALVDNEAKAKRRQQEISDAEFIGIAVGKAIAELKKQEGN